MNGQDVRIVLAIGSKGRQGTQKWHLQNVSCFDFLNTIVEKNIP